ncbi:MAG: hypothetical protein H6741_12340 [Alphaproteobacteria bacterium]|nr:hypothetical protein [Alphaproteobacteria bacterium]MCB9793503.1 hypothetical protein [Alphaproteobacteria bacterium]
MTARLLRGLTLGLLCLAASPAMADEDLLPKGDVQPALIRSSDTRLSGVYYPLAPGETLSFDVTGPTVFRVYARQRVVAEGGALTTLDILGDGGVIPNLGDIPVAGALDPSASLLDVGEGKAGVVTEKRVNLFLEGAHVLGVRSDAAGPALLIRVVEVGEEEAAAPVAEARYEDDPLGAALADAGAVSEAPVVEPVAEPVAEPAPVVEPVAEPAPVAEPVLAEVDPVEITENPAPADDPWAIEAPAEPEALTPEEVWPTPAPIVEATPEASGVTEAPVPPPEPRATGFDAMSYGVKLGFGSAASATRMSGYIGLEARLPLSERIGLTASLGRYGIRYDGALAVQPSIGGLEASTESELSWTTRVRPLEVSARYQRSIGGDVQGFGSAGLATYLSTRVPTEGDKVRGLSLGTVWALGMDIPIGPGVLSPTLSLNTGRRGFDNTSVDGDEARERLRTGRFNTAYLLTF